MALMQGLLRTQRRPVFGCHVRNHLWESYFFCTSGWVETGSNAVAYTRSDTCRYMTYIVALIYIYTHMPFFCCIKGSNHLRLFTAVSDTMSPLWVSSWGVGLSLPLATCCRVIGFVCGTRDVEDVVRWRCLGNSRCWGWSDRCGADAFCLWPYGWSWKGRIPVDETLRPCHLEN